MLVTRTSFQAFQQFLKHDIQIRYRGSYLGILWSFVTPLLLLTVFTFVFSVVFKQRWPGFGSSPMEFGLIVFAGLTAFNILAEVLNRAPTIIASKPNLVKKVVFPIELLPVILVGGAIFHAMIAFGVFLVMHFFIIGAPPATAVLLPAALLPLVLFCLGLAWFLGSIGVFLRDITEIMGPVITGMLFFSPIFFPIASLPPWMQGPASLNPLAITVEHLREVLIFGSIPDIGQWALATMTGALFAWLGYQWFHKTQKGFADVL